MKNSEAAPKRKRRRTSAALEAEMMESLIRRKESYENFFEAKKEGIDPKVEQAYANIIKLILEFSRELSRGLTAPEKKDPEEMKKKAEEILEREYGIKRS